MADSSISAQAFGQMIQQKRGKRGLRPTAAEIGISYSALSRMENALVEPEISTLRKVCAWLGVDPAPYITALLGATGFPDLSRSRVQVIFPKRGSMTPKTSRALTTVILAEHRE